MKFRKLLLFLGVFALGSAIAVQQGGGDLEQNFANTRRLLEVSSAAQRIEQSGNTEAQALRAKAKALYESALQARGAGDEEQAAELLKQTKMQIFAAVRLAGSGQVGIDKKKTDYDNRAASIRALLDAHKRVLNGDRAKNGAELPVEVEVERLLGEAEKHYAAGDFTTGKVVLDDAYGKLKVSIEHMRGGETLVNSVDFKTIEEEYEYYRVKVESQQTAITTVSQSVAGTPKEQSVKTFLEKMETGRVDAAALAGKGDYAAALEVLKPLFMQAPYRLMSLLQ